MKTRIISFLLLFISCNALQAQLKIIGGSAIDITQRPYQAAIFINGQFNGGGVILNNQWILTAAHVIDGYSASSISVSTGYTNLNSDSNPVLRTRLLSIHNITIFQEGMTSH